MHAPSRSTSRSSLACRPCRSQHLKCDSVRPVCTRCETLSKPCSYPESRRGPKARAAATQASQIRASTAAASPLATATATASDTDSSPSLPPDGAPPNVFLDTTVVSVHSTATPRESNLEDSLLDLYYRHFHPTHPFVLPQTALRARLQDPASTSLERLASVMRYIGSFYQESAPVHRDHQGDAGCDAVDGFVVQATLLQSLAKSMCDDSEGASELLALAIAQSTSIGMDKSYFANAVAAVDPVLAESWRRSWWMIYVADTNFAIIRWDFHQFLACHDPEVDLPCDEVRYNRLDIPPRSASFQEYQNREYALVEQTYSSFAYFIEASSIYLESLQASTQYKSTAHAENVCSDWEAAIVSWFLMLPGHLRELTARSAVSDQLMFQAHMMMHTSLAFIHRPLSSLQYDPAEARSSCRPPPPPLSTRATVVDPFRLEMHSEKLFRAIKKQNQYLVLLPTRTVQLSPFIICTIACCTIVHLVACKVAFDAEETRAARSRIRVTLGTLKHYQDIWPRANRLINELKLIANDLLQATALGMPLPILNTTLPVLDESTLASMFGEQWNRTLEK